MFNLVEMKDTVRIPPSMFHMRLQDAVEEQLSMKLANKVVLNVGLCISLYEITKLGESHILPGDGASHTKVHFNFVVFHPFLEEIIVGKIRSCSIEGVHVSLGFFDDIFIPKEALQHPSRFDEKEHLWVWEYTAEGSGEKHDLYMDQDEPIRFRVIEENFFDTYPSNPEAAENADMSDDKKIPYSITATISEPGLGLLSWWS